MQQRVKCFTNRNIKELESMVNTWLQATTGKFESVSISCNEIGNKRYVAIIAYISGD